MTRLSASIALAGLTLVSPALVASASAADLREPARADGFSHGFLATCEDLGRFCFADACGRDQIEAAQGCRARCPSAVVLGVVPATCPVPEAAPDIVLRRRG